MEHLIRFRTAEGIDGSHVAHSLDDAIAFVERLRNAEDASDVTLYRLTEIPIEFKPYYKVEVGGVDQPAEATLTPVTAAPPPAAVIRSGTIGTAVIADGALQRPISDPLPDGTPELPESAAANGRRLFSRG